ncbi:hypothetical protein [Nonomuraea sp. JJY05]|uniref:hypothetical protein n=1 Tax=Nonomuraea sp. JJY05 TaxID=3350255 RepID=UPI00373E9266
MAADLCNGVKHRKLRAGTSKTGDDSTRISNQSVSISLGSPVIAEHQWYVTSGGQKYDVIELADDIVEEWNAWLTAQNLLCAAGGTGSATAGPSWRLPGCGSVIAGATGPQQVRAIAAAGGWEPTAERRSPARPGRG